MPSSPLIATAQPADAPLTVAPWTVTTCGLGWAGVIDLLGACLDRPALAPGTLIGADLAYWATAMRFAAILATRQRFLPGVVTANGRYHARWEPVCFDADAECLARLVAAMPAACRAVTAAGVTAPPESSAREQLVTFITLLIDHLVRTANGAVAGSGPYRRNQAAATGEFSSLHDQWVHALTTPDGQLQGRVPELAALVEQVRSWRRPVAMLQAAPFRLCFRLEEPGAPDATGPAGSGRDGFAIANAGSPDVWPVRYLLQAVDDPSLMLPVADAWHARGAQARIFQQRGVHARELVLAALGQAARLAPAIEQSLQHAPPAGYTLNSSDAHAFLTETAPALEQAGFRVLVPTWWTGQGSRLRLGVRAKVKSPGLQAGQGLSLDQVLEVDWQVALGDTELSLNELAGLAKLKSPLVNVRGRWVQVSSAELERAVALLRRRDAATLTLRDVVRMGLGAQVGEEPLAVTGVTATGGAGDLLARLQGDAPLAELAPAPGFTGQLRPYQMRGYSWLAFLRQWGLGACLADDMGLGKTVQTLALIQKAWHEGARQPVLLICPTSVVRNWQLEARRFTPDLPVLVHHGTERGKDTAFVEAAAGQALVISTYALLQRDLHTFQQLDWGGLILDEAQNVKNAETKQARAARELAAGFRIALTGTPVENNIGDLWSIMQFLNPGLLGNQAEFRRRYFVPIQVERNPDAAARLQQVIRPFILRRVKTDRTIIDDLPEKTETKVFCHLTKEQASLYAAVVDEAREALAAATGMERRGLVLATLMKLKQVCNHPAQFLGDNSALAGRSGKLARLAEMFDELLAVGDRALVFTRFAQMGRLLRRFLQESFGREVLFLHGGVPKPQRDAMVERFQQDGGPPVLILSLKAGGTGLNLTGANHVFHFDRWWNPAVENQATDRAFRIGQTRQVQVHKFVCAGTLEEKIDAMVERKQELADRIVGTGESWLTELSTAELQTLFTLERGAVAG